MKRPSSMNFKRRTVLQGMGGALGAAALGCGSSGDEAATGGAQAGAGVGGAGGNGGGNGGGGNGGAGGAGEPNLCASSDLAAAELLKPIENIVVLCMENRSFDHYLGSLKL